MLIKVCAGGGQPLRFGARVVVEERENFAPRRGSRSISSSGGITICLDDVSYPVVQRQIERRRGDDDQFEIEWRVLIQHGRNGTLGVAANPLNRHEDRDFRLN